jgi:hypothetical protein
MRPLTLSVTARIPAGSEATPIGVLNWPVARPDVPIERSSVPPRS